MDYSLREATPSDIEFLRAMLFEAAYWRGGQIRPEVDEALADRELSKIVDGFGRHGDAGVIAVTSDGTPIGAAWYRHWTEDDHSYGFVSENVPELAIGVIEERRGEGVGAALVREILAVAAREGVLEMSLSVERDNPALRLYERTGFEKVGEVENAWTMVASTGAG